MSPEEKIFVSSHNLPFECAPWITGDFFRFKIGTCYGLWRASEKSYDILAVSNDVPGNGHFEDVLEWFKHSCIRDKKNLLILDILNEDFRKHLINKRGFVVVGIDHAELPLDKILLEQK